MSVTTTTKNKATGRSAAKTSARKRSATAGKPAAAKRSKAAAGVPVAKKTTAPPAQAKTKGRSKARPAVPRKARSRAAKPNVTVILVSRSDTASLRLCLDALKADSYTRRPSCTGNKREVFVIDTGGGEYTPEVVKEDYPGVSLFRRPDNLGGARSTNMAMSAAGGQYLLLLDPNVTVSKTTVADMADYLEGHRDVGAVSAAVYDSEGHPGCRPQAFPTVRNELVREWGRLAAGVGVHVQPATIPAQPASVDWIARRCMMIRRDALRQVGPLDDGYSTYFTEADWCRRARAIGWSVHFHPGIKVVALPTRGAQARAQTEALRGWPKYQFDSSRRHYFRKHHGPSAAAVVDILHCLRQAADATKAALQKTRTRGGEIAKALKDKLEQPQRQQPL